MEKQTPLIILTGPTAVGKTALSLRLAHAIGGSVISADSMQVYRRMDIGTAKIMPDEMDGIPHYLIDVLEPDENFDVVLFQQMAKQAITDIIQSGRIPILTGGTGFYIQALLYDIDFTEEGKDSSYRESLEKLATEKGAGYLHDLLKEADPDAAQQIHKNNIKRVIRALEYHHKSGERISVHNATQRKKESDYNYLYFVLTDDRQILYDRIDRRVDAMLEAGLIEEVKALRAEGLTRDNLSMQGLGYKEILSWMDGEIEYEEAVRILKRDTRHFAKRQLTWFRREREVIWFDRQSYPDDDSILKQMLHLIQEKGICS